MLDIPRLKSIRLNGMAKFQKALAVGMLAPNYNLPPRVRITLEGLEHLRGEPAFLAMNHTDRYNYWPFQYEMWRRTGRHTATWVKGKYYEHPLLAWFMSQIQSLPTVSRGYILIKDFEAAMGRKPKDEEYKLLRGWIDTGTRPDDDELLGSLGPLLERPRDVFGLPFEPSATAWNHYVDSIFTEMMDHFLVLHERAFAQNLHLLIFPQGTRSVRLSRGRIGLSQVALYFKRPIVPIGCSGSDKVYPGGSPWAKGGCITYRVGEPIPWEEMERWAPKEAFVPFSREAERDHRELFQGLADMVMDRINALVDEPYRFSEDLVSDGESGHKRFV